ncbi:MAG: Cobalamin import ATP-binding protein BtuD [Methanoregula sp. PtaU1.Bin051]|nr:MAG: Cobalamin import ATP-binding protein BtuD [Methanoregula sp. PtaU1.Bin051]
MVKIIIQDLSFRYRSAPVLQGLSFNVGKGKVFGLLGPNGSGKSTLIKCINQILRPQGRVVMDGNEIHRMHISDVARRIGYVPQSETMGMSMTVYDAVLMGRRVHMGWRPAKRDLGIVDRVLHDMKIENLAMEDLWELSGGQRQKVFIARALAQEPEVLLLDEPTSSLDLKHQLDTMETVRSLVSRSGISVVMAIHDINLAARYADTVAMIRKGSIYGIGSPRVLFTPQTVRDVYGVEATFLYDTTGNPVIVPVRGVEEGA